jgi:aspartyl-tRNA synthetase
LIAELTALKLSFKTLTGEDFGPKPEEKKKKEPAEETKREGPSKAELNKLKKKADKAAKREAEKIEKGIDPSTGGGGAASGGAAGEVDEALAHLFGDSPLIQSAFMTEKVYRQIGDLTEDIAGGTSFWVRGRLSNSRPVGKGVFIVLRQGTTTVQAVMFQGSQIPKAMVKYAAAISLESIVDIRAEVTIAESPIQACTIKTLELSIQEIHVVSRAQELPFLVEDAGRNEAEAQATGLPMVQQDTALNFRWIDTRTPANQAIFRIQSGVCQLFREFLISKKFVEIHTPKLIGGASEGGSNVFTLKYFDSPACLAQSPQLYKQMAAACGGFDRVFEVGPVFRAENSNTHRHLCEFTGLDFEMAINEHYYEALEVRLRLRLRVMCISPFSPFSYPPQAEKKT